MKDEQILEMAREDGVIRDRDFFESARAYNAQFAPMLKFARRIQNEAYEAAAEACSDTGGDHDWFYADKIRNMKTEG